MAAYASQAYPPSSAAGSTRFNAPASLPPSTAPPGTFAPGTKVQVGSHRVIIEKYLSEGGFAHVYVVRLPTPIEGVDQAVLKRVAVPDKDNLANMRTEVETMKKLKGHRHIVKYFDSHASQLKAGGYEVFLLMEFCSGGGLIDFMNTRLQHRLTEPEILHIFSDIAEGVATMHYLKPPLLHRDLKVENVLITTSKSTRIYKVCDFGSTAPPRPAATSAAEGRLIEDDVQRHTTLQYRSPEMIDVYRKQPIDEKSDIWALGVLLYKLCYYTTPFEEVGQMAILNASFKFPSYPKFSDRLKLMIGSMLKENPQKRPNIYQVLKEVCSMRNKSVPIKDIYTNRTASEARRNQQLPPSPTDDHPRVGAALSPPTIETPVIPNIEPMRRGRPTKPVSHHGSAKPSPSPLRMMDPSDPFAALDGSKTKAADELSARFPKLDQFSLLQDPGRKFEFDPSREAKAPQTDLSSRVTMALADDAFVSVSSKPAEAVSESTLAERPLTVAEQAKNLESKSASPRQDASLSQPIPKRPAMVSTGTMTTPSPPLGADTTLDSRPTNRLPPPELQRRPSSQPWSDRIPLGGSSFNKYSTPSLSALSSTRLAEPRPRSPASSRPSLELSRPAAADIDAALSRSKSVTSRRPMTINVPKKGETQLGRSSRREATDFSPRQAQYGGGDLPDVLLGETTENTITSDMDFLRAKEEEENERKKEKRMSSGSLHMKRASLPAISLSGTKNLLAGRFGEAFRKFEGNQSGQRERSPSPQREPFNVLTPISGSVATDDEEHALDETEEVSPEIRRELERRRLSTEEKRVANAAAEYKKRLATQGGTGGSAGPTRAATIQNKVQSLLQENDKPALKSATGYGRFTDSNTAVPQVKQFEPNRPSQANIERKPLGSGVDLRKLAPETRTGNALPPSNPYSSVVPQMSKTATDPRPQAPPKPKTLRTGQNEAASSQPSIKVEDNPISPNEDWEASFSKRYPSLSGLEMVETDVGRPRVGQARIKEV